MKATGMVRKLDDLGRLTIPKSLRDNLRLEEGTPMEIFTFGNQIVLEKYEREKLSETDFCWLQELVENQYVDTPTGMALKERLLRYIKNEVERF